VAGSTWIADAHVDLLLEVAARRTNGEENPFAQDYPAVADGLRCRGHDEETISALLHGNLLRFLRRALPAT
jgi:microsomal dipeptidase-like Zn-dependent dipeptidase